MSRHRVAFLSTWHPEPVDNGRKQRTRQMITALADDHEIALISLLPAEALAGGPLPGVPGVWRQWALPLPAFHPRSPASIVAGLRPLPRSLVATWDPDTAATIARIVQDIDAGAAIGTDLRTLRYLLSLGPSVRAILDEPDVSFIVEAAAGSRGFRRLRALGRLRKYRRLLEPASRRLDAVIVASEIEATAYRQLAGSSRVTVLENGVSDIPQAPWTAPDSSQLLYTGSVTYGPNAEAVAYFVRAVLPELQAAVPSICLAVTGDVPARVPPAARDPHVRLTGRLPSLDAIYRASRVFVAPLRSGTGTRIKLLEAMAFGMPVVSTSKGAEGLEVIDGEHLLIADEPDVFAAATLRLLRDAALSASLGAASRSLVESRYHWTALGRRFRDLVDGLVTSCVIRHASVVTDHA